MFALVVDQGTRPALSSKFAEILGQRIHYVEDGRGGPPVLLLHGIPTHSYLWRNVIPRITASARVVAPDLLGFGKSSQPLDATYDLDTQVKHLAAFIDALGLEDVIIAGIDLGLIIGLEYAMRNSDNVRGLVLMEGLLVPTEVHFKHQPLAARMVMKLMHNYSFAEKTLVHSEQAVARMLASFTAQRLRPAVVDAYAAPFTKLEVRRRVLLDGIGPYQIRPRSLAPGDIVDRIRIYCGWLQRARTPKLLLHASPGMAVNQRIVNYAQDNIANLRTRPVGRGKHLLPEDQPHSVGNSIAEFQQELR